MHQVKHFACMFLYDSHFNLKCNVTTFGIKRFDTTLGLRVGKSAEYLLALCSLLHSNNITILRKDKISDLLIQP